MCACISRRGTSSLAKAVERGFYLGRYRDLVYDANRSPIRGLDEAVLVDGGRPAAARPALVEITGLLCGRTDAGPLAVAAAVE